MNAPIPAGWYPDPAAASPSSSAQLRWWNGADWTAHLRPADSPPPATAGSPTAGFVPGSEYGGRVGFGSAPSPPAEPPAASAARGSSGGGSGVGGSGGFVNEVGQPGSHRPPADHQRTPDPSPGHNQQPGRDQQPPPGYGRPPQGHLRSPYTEASMAVSQKRKLIELTNEYDIYGTDGAIIGRVVEVGQSGLKKAARFLSSLDQYMTHRLEVRDAAGQVIMLLTRPAKIVKSTVVVTHPNGAELGRLVQQNVFGKIRFSMEAGGREVGTLGAENWIAWNFRLTDHTGAQVGRITKTFEGFLTTMFTTADKYAVELSPQLTEPLKSLCVAAALCVDTALKQDSRGFG